MVMLLILAYLNLLISSCYADQNEVSTEYESSIFGCTYSITLYNSGNAGWGGSTANVSVSKKEVLTDITLIRGSSGDPIDFPVIDGAAISVLYKAAGSTSYKNSFTVSETFSIPAVPQVYSSMPYYTAIQNPCNSSLCQYSATLLSKSGRVSLIVYVAGKTAIDKVILTSAGQTARIAFTTTRGESIVGLISFENQNDWSYYDYTLYEHGISTPFFAWQDYVKKLNGPATPASIPNFCGVPELKLTLYLGSYTPGSLLIPVSVVPSTLAQNAFAVKLTLTCGAAVPSNRYRLSSSSPTDFINFNVLTINLQTCNLIAYSDDPAYPYAASESVYFGILLSNVPSTIYSGQNFNLTILTSIPPITTGAELQLICDTSTAARWFGLAYNSILTLTLPATVNANPNCYLTTVPLNSGIYAGPVPIAVSRNVQTALVFTNPVLKEFNQSNTMNIKVSAPGSTSPIRVEVNWNCNLSGYSTKINITTSTDNLYTFPNNAYGGCVLTIPNPPEGYISPIPATFTIFWQLTMLDYPTTIYPTQYFTIEIDPLLPTGLATATTLLLVNSTATIQTWLNIPFNQLVDLQVRADVPINNNYRFKTDTKQAFVRDTISSAICVNQIPMLIETPRDGDLVIQPKSFPLLVTTPSNNSIAYGGTAELACGSSNKTKSYTTNVEVDFDYDENFYGSCVVSLLRVPSYFDASANVTISIKFKLTFTTAPTFIAIDKPFNIEISSSGSIPSDIDKVAVGLECQSIEIQSWPEVKLNELVTLYLDPVDLPDTSVCRLLTFGHDDYFIQTSTDVIVVSISSPFGGSLSYISPEQVTEFVQNFPASIWNELTEYF